jgi:hypothetical protein
MLMSSQRLHVQQSHMNYTIQDQNTIFVFIAMSTFRLETPFLLHANFVHGIIPICSKEKEKSRNIPCHNRVCTPKTPPKQRSTDDASASPHPRVES